MCFGSDISLLLQGTEINDLTPQKPKVSCNRRGEDSFEFFGSFVAASFEFIGSAAPYSSAASAAL